MIQTYLPAAHLAKAPLNDSGVRTDRAGSASAGGVVRAENMGHTVEYRGMAARRAADGTPSLGGGVRGSWHIDHPSGKFSGEWHLWPVMLSSSPAPAADDDTAEGESECCVCYDRPIDTGLEPCGHVALCAGCASRLRPRRCPLCRANIQHMTRVERAAPTGAAH